ncbi:MAG: hypothetical protein IPL46_19835 [Saprospiraceae bacterium]|nr:hypothetical protein [Saprospiraceae bacterium]
MRLKTDTSIICYYRTFLLASFCALSPVWSPLLHAQSSEDIAQIKELVGAYANAREENNEDKIRQLFTSEADQLVS